MTDLFDNFSESRVLAKKRNRVFAGLFDFGLAGIVSLIMTIVFGERSSNINGQAGYVLTGPLTAVPFVFLLLTVYVLEAITGQSLGKKIFKLQVLSADYTRAKGWQILVRHLFDIIDWAPGFGIVGLLVASNNAYSQRVGDLVAKTIVVTKD